MIPTSAHNEALSGDTLYSAFLNYEWRKIVLPFIIAGMEQLAASIEDESDKQDFEVLYGAMIDDFYNEEIVDGTPVGSIVAYPDDTPPSAKWLYLNGQSLLQAAYPELYTLIGNFYTVPPSETHFNIPDFRDKNMRGATNGLVIGTAVGADTHALSIAELPAHSHQQRANTGTGGAIAALRRVADTTGAPTNDANTTGSTGNGDAHNNIPRSILMAYMIKALP